MSPTARDWYELGFLYEQKVALTEQMAELSFGVALLSSDLFALFRGGLGVLPYFRLRRRGAGGIQSGLFRHWTDAPPSSFCIICGACVIPYPAASFLSRPWPKIH